MAVLLPSLFPYVLAYLFFLSSGVHADVDTYYQSDKFEKGSAGKWPSQQFKSSKLTAPVLNYVQYGHACRDGLYTFIAVRGSSVTASTAGPMILDEDGHLVWTKGMGQTYNMDMQMYKGEPYLTFWSGDDSIVGHGQGTYYMLDSSYEAKYKLNGANGLRGDLHEFHITLDNTAVYSIYDKVPADLSSVGGSKRGWLWDGTFQEVDPETNEVLFQWRASEHLPLTEGYRGREGHGNRQSDPWDFFHINSIDKDEKGNFLISSRYYFSLTYIDGRTGDIIWKLGGKDNMFEDLSDGAATNISYQHHARFRDGGKSITIFDNSGRGKGAPIHDSRGLWIDIDQVNMTAKVRGQFWNPVPIQSQSQGSVQVLKNGNVLVDYGYNAAWTEYKPNGDVVCEVHMGPYKDFDGGEIITYRAFKHPWVGKPTSLPDWTVPDEKGTSGYVSWNGATEVKTWILEGSHAQDPDHEAGAIFGFISATPRNGFETTIAIPDNNTYAQLRVAGLDKNGQRLGSSAFTKVSAMNTTDVEFDESTSDDADKGMKLNKKVERFLFFLAGFSSFGIVLAAGLALMAYCRRRRSNNSAGSSTAKWWDNLRFRPVKSVDDEDDVEDLSSEMNELVAAHADEFVLEGDDSEEDEIEESKEVSREGTSKE